MRIFNTLTTGFFGLILILLFISVIIMWFCAPVLLYMIYQKMQDIEKLLKNKS